MSYLSYFLYLLKTRPKGPGLSFGAPFVFGLGKFFIGILKKIIIIYKEIEIFPLFEIKKNIRNIVSYLEGGNAQNIYPCVSKKSYQGI